MKFSKMALAAALVASASMAWATGSGQTVTTSVVNSGNISNTLNTSASVSGLGSSFSGATGSASSVSNGTVSGTVNPVCTGACGTVSGGLAIEGLVETSNTGTAFNVSTGGGSGSASSVGSAYGALNTNTSYKGPGQSATLNGDSSANSSVGVVATANTGGAASAGNSAEYSGSALVGSSKCTTTQGCGSTSSTEVFGNVSDNKEQTSWATTGTMTVDNVVLENASTVSNASAVTNVNGSFIDPQ